MLRYYNNTANNYEENSFLKNMENLGHYNSTYVNEYLNILNEPFFTPFLSGQYGYNEDDLADFVNSSPTPTNKRIENCSFCFDSGVVIYSEIDTGQDLGNVLAIKFVGEISVQIRENATIIDTISNDDSGLILWELTQDFTNINVKITAETETCIYGITLNEPSVDASFCGETETLPIENITPLGSQYNVFVSNFYNTNFVWNKILPGVIVSSEIQITYSDGTITTASGGTLSATISAAITDLLELDCYEVNYTNVGPTEDEWDCESLLNILSISVVYDLGGTFETRNLTRTGSDFIDYTCCQVTIGDYTSEPFSLVNETSKNSYIYTPTDYKNGLLKGHDYKMLLDLDLKRSAAQETNVFEGQSRNYVVKQTNLYNRVLKTKNAIPDYLCEVLVNSLAYDVYIDTIGYTRQDEPTYDFLEDTVLLAEFEVELRLIK